MFFKKLDLDGFVGGLRSAWGDNLVSLVLFGSAARGEFSEDSDYNLLAVVKRDTPLALKPALPLVRRWARGGHPAPAVFTGAKIAVSADVFPLEFADIRDHRKVLFGPDPLSDLVIQPRNLRHQLENELWENIQRLRRSYLSSDGKPRTLLALMAGALPAALVLFRHALRLFGGTPPAQKNDVLAPLSGVLSVDLSVFDQIRGLRGARPRMTVEEMEAVFGRYLAALDRVAAAVNAFTV